MLYHEPTFLARIRLFSRVASAYEIFVVNGNVYCGGFAVEKGNTYESMVHWKNGDIFYNSKHVPVQLNRAMAMRGEEVYIGGSESKPAFGYPAYFKDRTTYFISDNPGSIEDMLFVGDDMYAVGSTSVGIQSGACMWKNSVITMLPNDAVSSFAYKIKLVGDDIYVVGATRDKSNLYSLVLWKNGNPTYLTTGATIISGVGLDVLGDDVYILATLMSSDGSYKIVLWKNGVPSYLTDSKTALGRAMVLQ